MPERCGRRCAVLIVADEHHVGASTGEKVFKRRAPVLQSEVQVAGWFCVCPIQPAAKINGAEVRAKIKVPNVRHVAPSKRFSGVDLREVAVLAPQGAGLVRGMAVKDENRRIQEQARDDRYAGDVGVIL